MYSEIFCLWLIEYSFFDTIHFIYLSKLSIKILKLSPIRDQ